jgi:hypothetical protein
MDKPNAHSLDVLAMSAVGFLRDRDSIGWTERQVCRAGIQDVGLELKEV